MKPSAPTAVHGIPESMLRDAVPIESVTRWPGNPREHDIEALRESLAKYGQPKQVLVQQSSGYIFAGNGIHEAAEAEGWTHIARTVLDWPDLRCREYLLDDNKLHERGSDPFDAVARFLADIVAEGGSTVGYEKREVDRFLAALVQPAGDAIPDVAEKDVWVKPGDVFRLGDHVLACGDAFDVELLAFLALDGTADCIFTSPPYAVGVDYGGTYEDSIGNLRSIIEKAAHTWKGVVRPGGFAVINFGDIVSGREMAGTDEVCEYPMALEYWPAFRSEGWLLWSRRAWCKPHARVEGPWTASSNRASSDFEHVWTWKLPGKPIVSRMSGSQSSANGWFDTSNDAGVDVGKDIHGAGMALGAALRMVTIHSERDGIVHEPFMGTGTTLIACEQLGRRCIGTELSPRYVQITLERWEQFSGKKATQEVAQV